MGCAYALCFARAATAAVHAAAGAGPTEALEEIVVTAERREEPLQQIPVAVTALTGDDLQTRQIRDLTELQQVVPGLVIWPILGNSATATINLRGQVEPDLLPTYDPAVGVYLDGVYIARNTGANLELIDMDRVEVLRGPQGTLFGRNTTGGAISLTTQKPQPVEQGSLEARFGNYNLVEVTGILNLPLEAAGGAMRAVARHSGHSGYGHSLLVGSDLSDENTSYARGQLTLPVGGSWNMDIGADYTDDHNSAQLITLVAAFPPDDQIPALTGHPNDSLNNYVTIRNGNVHSNRVGAFDMKSWGTTATVQGPLGALSLTSITAYRDLSSSVQNTDLDGTPYDLGAVLSRSQDEHQFSEELQLHATNDARGIDAVAGALWFAESAAFHGHGLGPLPLDTTEGMLGGVADNQSAAVYADAIFRSSTRTRVHAGLRYNIDWRQLISQNAAIVDGAWTCALDPSVVDAPGVCQATLPRRQFHFVPFSVGIDWLAAPGAFAYGKVSRNQRSGGYNMRGHTDASLATFGPENVTTYELGVKAESAAHALRANVAVYYTDYSDIQVGLDVPDPLVGTSFVKANGGHARIQGFEGEFAALVQRLRIEASIGITDGKYLSFAPNVDGLTDNSPLGLPKLTYSIGLELPFHLARGEMSVRADYGYHSSDADNVFRDRCQCNNAYGVANAQLAWSPRPATRLSLWARNLTNTHYMAQWVDGGDFIDAVPGDPRTYGFSLAYQFGEHP